MLIHLFPFAHLASSYLHYVLWILHDLFYPDTGGNRFGNGSAYKTQDVKWHEIAFVVVLEWEPMKL